MKAKLPEG